MATADYKYCQCDQPIRVVGSPIDQVDTCRKCGSRIQDLLHCEICGVKLDRDDMWRECKKCLPHFRANWDK
jgi:hypothetical protein